VLKPNGPQREQDDAKDKEDIYYHESNTGYLPAYQVIV